MTDWYKFVGDDLVVSIHAQPGARIVKKNSVIQGLYGDALKIRISAPPVDGRANTGLIKFLAEKFCVLLRNVGLLSGVASRAKRFRITGSVIDPLSLLD